MDNARDAEQVEPLIPPAGSVLIVTSRNRFTLPGLRSTDLDVLRVEDARLCGRLALALRAGHLGFGIFQPKPAR
jgi:hypothetical protein